MKCAISFIFFRRGLSRCGLFRRGLVGLGFFIIVFSLQGAGARLAESLLQVQDAARLQEIDKIDKKGSLDRFEQQEELLGREIETHKQSVTVLEKKRDQLSFHLNEKDAHLKKMEIILSDREAQLAKIEQQFEREDKELQKSKQSNRMKDAIIFSFQRTKRWVDEQVSELQERFDELCEDIFGLQKEKEKLHEERNNQEKKIIQLNSSFQKKAAEASRLSQATERLSRAAEEQKEEYAKKSEKAHEDVKVASAERNVLESEYNDLVKREELHMQCKQDVQSVHAMHNQCLTSKKEIEHNKYQLENENIVLRKKLDKTESDLEVARKSLQELRNRQSAAL